MTVAVVTPWQDHLELAEDYFAALRAGGPDEVVIVDNGSTPPLDFGTHRLETNMGFSRACNYGLAEATSDIVVFLNNDIELISDGWLTRLVEAVEPGVLAGPLRYDLHSAVDNVMFPYIDGWCLAGTRDDLNTLGGFDTIYAEPAYYADNDLCLRARQQGFTLRDVMGGLFHKANVTAGGPTLPVVARVSAANRRIYLERARLALAVAA